MKMGVDHDAVDERQLNACVGPGLFFAYGLISGELVFGDDGGVSARRSSRRTRKSAVPFIRLRVASLPRPRRGSEAKLAHVSPADLSTRRGSRYHTAGFIQIAALVYAAHASAFPLRTGM